MKFYRVAFWTDDQISAGFGWYTRRKDAERSARDNGSDPAEDLTEVEVHPTKDGILAALSRWARHPDNG
jgi:hypothetical protein